MNSANDPAFPPMKRCTSPRPPAVGEEVKTFDDTSQCSETFNCRNMEYKHKIYTEAIDRSETPTCSKNQNEPIQYTLNSPSPSPPPAYKWAQSLSCLLEDHQGVSLFQQFLKQEGLDENCLSTCFLFRGLKKNDPMDKDNLFRLAKLIFKKVKKIAEISDQTKEEIKQKLSTKTDIDDTIFDAAQNEIEMHMMKTTYPNFLKSDLYIQHLEKSQNKTIEKDCSQSPEPVDLLPTVHEDSELHIDSSNKIPLSKSNLLHRNRIPYVSKSKSEETGYIQSPYSTYTNYHSKYGSFVPTSAQDSELQSLSSDAQTDDAMSVTDGSSVDYPVFSRSKQKHSQKSAKHMNKDKLNHGAFIPRTERLPETKPLHPVEFHSLLVKKLNKIFDEQRMKEKITEKLKSIENSECLKSDGVPSSNALASHKSNSGPVFESGLFYEDEENDQDILDQHISRVFNDSGPHTPLTGCTSPPAARQSVETTDKSRVPQSRGNYDQHPRDTTHKYNQTVPNCIRLCKDVDTYSTDSAMVDGCPSDDGYKNQYPSDIGKRVKEHLKRYMNKKCSPMTVSTSSFPDSGISLASGSHASELNSRVPHMLESKRIMEEREQYLWRKSSTSPVLNRPSSSQKAVLFNNPRFVSQDISGYPVYISGASHQMYQESCMQSFPPDTTFNLVEASRRLEDESRSKMKLKCSSGGRIVNDAFRMKSFDDCHKKSRKSCPGAINPAHTISSEITVIGYSYGHHQEVPYLYKYPGKNVTLRQFKSILSKKGNFKYFFKVPFNGFGTGFVFEEVSDDSAVLPLLEGKIFCIIENVDEN